MTTRGFGDRNLPKNEFDNQHPMRKLKNMTTVEGTAQKSVVAVSGRKLVVLMFAFGILASGTLWTYWYYHTAPFVPLQRAISAEFPGSAPRVDGGQRKIHRGTPTLLWVIARVDFRPDQDSEKARQMVDRIVELTKTTIDSSDYEQVNVRLFQGELEKMIHKRDFPVRLKPGPLIEIE